MYIIALQFIYWLPFIIYIFCSSEVRSSANTISSLVRRNNNPEEGRGYDMEKKNHVKYIIKVKVGCEFQT